MSNVITDWRQAVQDHLETALAGVASSGVNVTSGPLTGVNREATDRVVVFHEGFPVIQREITLAQPTLKVRYFPTISKQPAETSPRDRGPLEQAEVDMLTAFAGKNRVGDFVDDLACRVTGATLVDTQTDWYVELELRAYTLNPAMPAA